MALCRYKRNAPARPTSLVLIACLGVLVEISVAPYGLPALPDSLTHDWDRFYSPFTREAGFLGVLIGALATALLQYKERIQTGPHLVLAPLSVGVYLTLPQTCLLYTSPSPRDRTRSRMPSSA